MSDPRYVGARRVLLDALEALAPHGRAIIVAGAQAVYLHTGEGEIAVAPYTTDGDLVLDPTLLGGSPELESAMEAAGFVLLEATPGVTEPGIWVATATVEGQQVIIPVDLIVPEGVAEGGGRRGARLGVHGKRAARRVPGLEAALVDHAPMVIAALDSSDTRRVEAEVAGPAALFVAKLHKIADRVKESKPSRLNDKDAADVFRLMQTFAPEDIGAMLARLRTHTTAGPPTVEALAHLRVLFASRRGSGVEMAVRALRVGVPEARVVEFCLGYSARLIEAAGT